MSPQSDGDVPIDTAVERVLSAAGRPTARSEFKAQLRARFIALEQVSVAVDAAPRAAVAQRAPQPAAATRAFGATTRSAPVGPRRSIPRVWTGLAAAAVLIGFTLYLGWPRERLWEVVAGSNIAGVEINGRSIAAGESDRLEALLPGAREIYSGNGQLRLKYAELFAIELAPQTRVRLAAFDAADRKRPFELEALEGSLHVCTSPTFAGSTMHIKAPDLELQVVGTSFALDVMPKGSCICCLEGKVAVEAPECGHYERCVDGGKMCLVYHDHVTPPNWNDISERHVGALRAFDEFARTLWK